MKRLFFRNVLFISFCTALMLLCLTSMARSDPRLPKEIVAFLNDHFQEWKLAPIHDEIRKQYETILNPSKSLNYITGDFNGDNFTDYAVYIAMPSVSNKSNKYDGFIVVLLQTKNGFDEQLIHQGNSTPYGFLAFVKAGTEGYNDETDETFKYKLDSIALAIYEKGFIRYTYQGNKFVVSESR